MAMVDVDKSVEERVLYLWRLRYELFMEELKRRGVYDMPTDTPEDRIRRAAQGWLAYVESLEKWREIVEREPPEVMIAMAKAMLSLSRLVWRGSNAQV